MMHGREKSDPSIVAVKLANKTGRPKAESVERREGAKGNTGEQHIRRTQSRESISQGLDRVRKAAQQKKKERFTALLHSVTVGSTAGRLFQPQAGSGSGSRWSDMAELQAGP